MINIANGFLVESLARTCGRVCIGRQGEGLNSYLVIFLR